MLVCLDAPVAYAKVYDKALQLLVYSSAPISSARALIIKCELILFKIAITTSCSWSFNFANSL